MIEKTEALNQNSSENKNIVSNSGKWLWNKMGSKGRFATGAGLLVVSHTVLIAVPVVHQATELAGLLIMLKESIGMQKKVADLRILFPKLAGKIVKEIEENNKIPKSMKEIVNLTSPKKVYDQEELNEREVKLFNFRNKFRKFFGLKPKGSQNESVAVALQPSSKEQKIAIIKANKKEFLEKREQASLKVDVKLKPAGNAGSIDVAKMVTQNKGR